MQTVNSAVIAAAGLGSRLGLGMPKCMIEIGGKTVLSRLIDLLRNHVDTIHVVVGYREELVIEHCAYHHREVVLVRNPDFRTTNTAHSYALGGRSLRGKTLFTDADLVFTPASMSHFFDAARDVDVLLGVAPSSSENAVFAHTQGDPPMITQFSRTARSQYEWGNILCGPSNIMEGASGFVFEHLTPRVPLRACVMESCEVDTAADLEAAHRFVEAHGL